MTANKLSDVSHNITLLCVCYAYQTLTLPHIAQSGMYNIT